MVQEAEKYKAEDEAAASRIIAKNGLESYAYNLRNTLTDDKLASKFDPADKTRPSWRLLSTRPFLGWIVLRRHRKRSTSSLMQKARMVLRSRRLTRSFSRDIVSRSQTTARTSRCCISR
jgi:hypothetical protein